MRISFDFDDTLSEPRMQRLAATFMQDGHFVCVVTARDRLMDNRDLKEVVQRLGIRNVYFTNGAYKYQWLNHLAIDIHFDDMPDEIEAIDEHCPHCIGVLIRP